MLRLALSLRRARRCTARAAVATQLGAAYAAAAQRSTCAAQNQALPCRASVPTAALRWAGWGSGVRCASSIADASLHERVNAVNALVLTAGSVVTAETLHAPAVRELCLNVCDRVGVRAGTPVASEDTTEALADELSQQLTHPQVLLPCLQALRRVGVRGSEGWAALGSVMLRVYARAGDHAVCATVWTAMRERQLHCHAHAFTEWLALLHRSGKHTEALAVLDQALSAGLVVWTCALLHTCVRHAAALGDFARAHQYWITALDGTSSGRPPLRPDLACYNAYLSLAATRALMRVCVCALDRMRLVHGVTPDAESYRAAMRACTLAHAPHTALSLFEDMRTSAGVAVTESTLHEAALTAAAAGDAESLREVLLTVEQMVAAPSPGSASGTTSFCDTHGRVAPTARLYTALTVAAVRCGQLDVAYSHLQAVRRLVRGAPPSRSGIADDARARTLPYMLVLSSAAAFGTPAARDVAETTVQQLREDGVPMTIDCVESMVLLYSKLKDGEAVRRLLGAADVSQLPRSAGMLAPLIRYGVPPPISSSRMHAADSAVENSRYWRQVFEDTDLSDGFQDVLAAWASVCADSNDASAAAEVFDWAQSAGESVSDLRVFEYVVLASVAAGRPEVASRAVRAMKQQGLEPSARIVEALSSAMAAEASGTHASTAAIDAPGRLERVNAIRSALHREFNEDPGSQAVVILRRHAGDADLQALATTLQEQDALTQSAAAAPTTALDDEADSEYVHDGDTDLERPIPHPEAEYIAHELQRQQRLQTGSVAVASGAPAAVRGPRAFKERTRDAERASFAGVAVRDTVARVREGDVSVPVPVGLRMKTEAAARTAQAAIAGIPASPQPGDDEAEGAAAFRELQREVRQREAAPRATAGAPIPDKGSEDHPVIQPASSPGKSYARAIAARMHALPSQSAAAAPAARAGPASAPRKQTVLSGESPATHTPTTRPAPDQYAALTAIQLRRLAATRGLPSRDADARTEDLQFRLRQYDALGLSAFEARLATMSIQDVKQHLLRLGVVPRGAQSRSIASLRAMYKLALIEQNRRPPTD